MPEARPVELPGDPATPSTPSAPRRVPPRGAVAAPALLAGGRARPHPSCGLLLHVATSQSALEVGLAAVIAQCQKRALGSGRAIPPLPPHPLLPAGLPGDLGRT